MRWSGCLGDPPLLFLVDVQPQPQPQKKALSQETFNTYWNQLAKAEFSNEQIDVLRRLAQHHYLNVDQAAQFLSAFSFSSGCKEAIILIYDRLVDPENVNRLYPFLNGSDQEAVEFHIRQAQRRQSQRRQSQSIPSPNQRSRRLPF